MPVLERLKLMVAALPDTATVTLPVGSLHRWIAEEEDALQVPHGLPGVYLNVSNAAELLDCTNWRVQQVCEEGGFPGAFRKKGKGWRIPAVEIERALAAKAETDRPGWPQHGAGHR